MLILHKGLNAEKKRQTHAHSARRGGRTARRKSKTDCGQEAHKQYARGAEILNNSVQKILKIKI